jgi:hypothetical protein
MGMPSDGYSHSDLLDCAKKAKEDLELNMPANKIGIEFISQVSFEICKYGYYEGKGGADRGKKFYPKSEK